jgi:hypothetical protein
MPLPGLQDGVLPPGVHQATLAEVVERFGYGSRRRAYLANILAELVDTVQRAGASAVAVGGSFVTEKEDPHDIDCITLLPDVPHQPVPKRWERPERTRLDLQICTTKSDLVEWFGFLQLRRDGGFTGCVQIPTVGVLSSEQQSEGSLPAPIPDSPIYPLDTIPREEKIEVLSKILFQDLQEEKARQESIAKKISRTGYELIKEALPIGKPVLPENFDVVWPDKASKPLGATDISNVDIAKKKLAIIESARNRLRSLPEVELNRFYTNKMIRSGVAPEVDALLGELLERES